MKPEILVLTPTLGNRKSLQKTVSSVKAIGGERVKHIIVAPQKEVIGLKTQFPNIEVLAEPEGCKGIYQALNYGFRKYGKDYRYLSFINDDDYWLDNYKKLITVLDKDISIEAVYGRVNYVNEKGEVIGKQTSSSRYKSFKALLKSDIILFTQQATLIRSELFDKVGGFDENYILIADTNFWMHAIDLGAKFQYENKICAAYSIQDGQLSSNGKLQSDEHDRLMTNVKISLIREIIENWLFRISNIRIYIRRIIKNKGVKRMSSLFHSNI